MQQYRLVTLKVLIHKAEEGGYWAEVPALPGCVSQGETADDVRANVHEAIEGWLLAEEGTTQPGHGSHHVFTMAGRRERIVIPIH